MEKKIKKISFDLANPAMQYANVHEWGQQQSYYLGYDRQPFLLLSFFALGGGIGGFVFDMGTHQKEK